MLANPLSLLNLVLLVGEALVLHADFDATIVAVGLWLCFLVHLEKKAPLRPAPKAWCFVLNLVCFFALFAMKKLEMTAPLPFYLAGLGLFTCGLLATLPVREFIGRVGDALPAASALLGVIYLRKVLIGNQWAIWPWLARPTQWVMRNLLVVSQMELLPTQACRGPHAASVDLCTKHFGVWIYAPCAGLEGVTLFASIFVSFLFVAPHRFTGRQLAGLFCGGVAYMFALNLFRMWLFFLAGEWVSIHYGEVSAYSLVGEMFHANVGFVTYLVGIGVFLSCVARFTSRPFPSPVLSSGVAA